MFVFHLEELNVSILKNSLGDIRNVNKFAQRERLLEHNQ